MKDAFAEKSKIWDTNPVVLEMTGAFSSELQKLTVLKKQHDLLEFGCGTGLVGLRLAPLANSVLMVDTSPAMLSVLRNKIASDNIPNVRIAEGDIRELNLPPSSADVIFSLMAFHHIENIPEKLKIFHHILKENGTVIIGDLLREDGSFHGGETVAHKGFSPEEIRGYFHTSGFHVENAYEFHTVKKPDARGILHEYPQFILCARKM